MKNLLRISLGNLIYTFAVTFFILPCGLLTGGTTGLGIFLQAVFGIPITVFAYIFNAATFLLGAWILGRRFALTTLLSTIEFPVFLTVLTRIADLTGPLTDDRLLATIFAGICIGVGIGIVIESGASTGGMDIPPLILHKKTGANVSRTLYICDFIILLLQIIVSGREQILYGILLVILYTIILDRVLIRGKRQIQLQIISPRYEEINRVITSDIDRGSTLVHVTGGFSRKPSMAVLTVVSPRELFKLQQLVKAIDPDAFITISEVREVEGRGFSIRKDYMDKTENA